MSDLQQITVAALKHLTGQHNQRLHGNRGPKVSNAAAKVQPAVVPNFGPNSTGKERFDSFPNSRAFSKDEQRTVDDTLRNFQKTIRLPVQITIGGKNMPDNLGEHFLDKPTAQGYVALDINRVAKMYGNGAADGYTKRWFGFQPNENVNYSDVLSHVVAHEIGHFVWQTHTQMSTELHKLPSGNRGRIQTNPKLAAFVKLVQKHPEAISEYGRHSGSAEEAFCDAISLFANGNTLHPALEDYFLENW